MRLVDIIMGFSPIPKDKNFRGMKEGNDLFPEKIDWLVDLKEFIRGICPDFELLNASVEGMEEYNDDNGVGVLGDDLVLESEFIRIQITTSEDSLGRHT